MSRLSASFRCSFLRLQWRTMNKILCWTLCGSSTTPVTYKRMLSGSSGSSAATFSQERFKKINAGTPTAELALKRFKNKSFESDSEKTPDRHDDATSTATHYPNKSRPCCCSPAHNTISSGDSTIINAGLGW